jgi:sec-independent protein translocase protein TatC
VQLTLVEHLRELRNRLFKALVSVLIIFVVGFIFSDQLFAFMMKAIPEGVKAESGTLFEGFQVRVKISLYFAIFLSLPVIITQIYGFVRPALRLKEDNTFRIYIYGGFILLAGSLAFTHFTMPHLVGALQGFIPGTEDIKVETRADILPYITTMLTIYLGFSICFQAPLIVFLTIVQDFVEAKVYTENRKWVIVILMILCAMFSPPDLMSMGMLFAPLYILFELAIIFGRLLARKRA